MDNDPDERSRDTDTLVRKNLTTLLQAVSMVGRTEISRRLGSSISTHSRITSDRLLEAVRLLSACGLKFAPRDDCHNSAESGEAAFVLTAYGLQAIRSDHRRRIEE